MDRMSLATTPATIGELGDGRSDPTQSVPISMSWGTTTCDPACDFLRDLPVRIPALDLQPRTLAEHVGPTLHAAAQEAGRPHDDVRVVASLPVSVTDQIDSARAHAAQQFAIYGRLPSYRAMLDREGYPGPQDAALIGDENTVTQRIDELRDAGVDEFVGLPFGHTPEDRARTRALLHAYPSDPSKS
jgi:hypothetical protein